MPVIAKIQNNAIGLTLDINSSTDIIDIYFRANNILSIFEISFLIICHAIVWINPSVKKPTLLSHIPMS